MNKRRLFRGSASVPLAFFVGSQARSLRYYRSEAQRIQQKFRPRAHRKDVANDSADAGGRALERLDRARMIVTLDLERDGPAIADIDHAGVFFAGLDENVRPGRRKFFNSRREFLYEQCSLHITEKIPSSVKFGSRPRIFLIRSNSSGVRPCLATISGVTSGSTMELTLFTRPNVI